MYWLVTSSGICKGCLDDLTALIWASRKSSPYQLLNDENCSEDMRRLFCQDLGLKRLVEFTWVNVQKNV